MVNVEGVVAVVVILAYIGGRVVGEKWLMSDSGTGRVSLAKVKKGGDKRKGEANKV